MNTNVADNISVVSYNKVMNNNVFDKKVLDSELLDTEVLYNNVFNWILPPKLVFRYQRAKLGKSTDNESPLYYIQLLYFTL